MLLTCILYCDAGPDCLITIVASDVVSYHRYHIYLCSALPETAVALLREAISLSQRHSNVSCIDLIWIELFVS